MSASAKPGPLWIAALLGMVFLSAFVHKEKAPEAGFLASTKGKTILLARADWDTSWFEAEIFRQLLQKLGYQVADAKTMNDTEFFEAVSHNEVNFCPSGWFPNSDQSLAKVKDKVQAVGYVVKAGALQGYLIDRKTSERYGIKNLQNLQKPEIARLFDIDNDGRADLIGCNPDWTCGQLIEHHIQAYGLRQTVRQVRGNYSSLMADILARYNQGKPVLFYTWTPNWTVGKLIPGEDVIWLEVPFPNLPKEQKEKENLTKVARINGCGNNPCEMGWPPNDIRVVANTAFLNENPAAKSLLERIKIPLGDISRQNSQMFEGEKGQEDIRRQAREWIDANRKQIDRWLSEVIQSTH